MRRITFEDSCRHFIGMPPAPSIFANRPLISVVIPMFNEEESLPLLFSRLQHEFSVLEQIDFELVLVNDGSSDDTERVATDLVKNFPRWTLLSLSRNFGQQSAYRAGLEAARGDALIFLDCDLQDPPSLIGELLEKWKLGFRVVTAVRTTRAERGLRRLAFEAFHLLFHRLTGEVMPKNSGMFSLVDRCVVRHLSEAREASLFLPALKNWFGYPQTTISYDRESRAAGEPKQSFSKLLKYALNGIISFSEKPLEWIGILGLLVSAGSFFYAASLLALKIAQWLGHFRWLEVPGFTTLAAGMFCLSGVQLCCMAILGQYIGRIYQEVKQRPHYVVETTRRQ